MSSNISIKTKEKVAVCREEKIVDVSFIIPAYNEEKNLPIVLASVRKFADRIRREIILVDNGSNDRTTEIARHHGALVLEDCSRTIGGLRNLGAKFALGKFLVFLDADVVLTDDWKDEFSKLMKEFSDNCRVITGSRYGVEGNSSWIEKHWFEPMTREKANYLNSGHLIIARDLFKEIGGFDESLYTSEDYDFCMRAKAKGVSVINNPNLLVIHKGYPKTLIAFIRREKWHGVQDFSNLQSFLKSWPAKASVFFCGVNLVSMLLSIYFKNYLFFVAGIAISSSLCVGATWRKARQFRLSFLHYFLIYHVYFFARGLSLWERITKRHIARRNTL
jgi:glycosyltransferase involved in cell wall biosynthesis